MKPFVGYAFGGVAALWLACLLSSPACAGEDHPAGAGIDIRESVKEKDLGVPFYPGAVPSKDPGDDSAALSFALWGFDSQVRIMVVQLETADALGDVARFYKEALAVYAPVLDCSRKHDAAEDGAPQQKHALGCDHDHADPGGRLFKAGSLRDMHIVSIKPLGDRTRIELVRLITPFD